MATDEGDEDIPVLSAYALAALQEFYDEQIAKQECVNTVQEDWQLSQFWYDEETTATLAEECFKESEGNIACISCPTLYAKLSQDSSCKQSRIVLLEYDKRFAIHGEDYVHYDYNAPLDVPDSIKSLGFDLVIADPPFLSEECLTKVSQTIRLLTTNKIILCTGTVMGELAKQILQVEECRNFIPRHRNNLANSFSCYVNYDSALK
ncbi:PREDICTED: protein-lysine N-methyltransferase n6amt2-like [Amphimedon queenslandica]|uniref:Protein-lysine N-methyltransferase 100637543 n=1 Tax=Amphimedon queenslandica TaxID=400682 RepID=A0A1X7UYL4_AMPQE|nr:PREDICTED: protein-lysine N-methyltransferase n6amt2-like [Amphimedon queenslandica]|eukprot:XP_003386264.1 PREDICTED: protein-lysine N-methyltransferase n6amt2-like [Amphimedon queenslandica]